MSFPKQAEFQVKIEEILHDIEEDKKNSEDSWTWNDIGSELLDEVEYLLGFSVEEAGELAESLCNFACTINLPLTEKDVEDFIVSIHFLCHKQEGWIEMLVAFVRKITGNPQYFMDDRKIWEEAFKSIIGHFEPHGYDEHYLTPEKWNQLEKLELVTDYEFLLPDQNDPTFLEKIAHTFLHECKKMWD